MAVAALLASCGDGDKAPAGADLETLQAEAGEALEQAKKLALQKRAPDEFARAKEQIADAEADLEAGDQKKAAAKYKSAASSLARLVEEQKQLGKDTAKVSSGEKAAAVEAKKKADAANAAVNAAALYAEAAEHQKKGEDLLASAGTKKTIFEAKQILSRARDLYEQATRAAAENEIDRKRFEDEKAVVAQVKEKAKRAAVEEKAADEWLQAEQLEREAQATFDRGEFRTAVEQIKQTAVAYRNGIRRVTSAAEYAELVAKGEADAKEREKKQAEADEQRGEEPAARAVRKELAAKAERRKTADGKDGKKGASAAIALFDEYDPTSYPQELDAEDEAFLNEHHAELTKSGVIEYDPTTHAVRLNYVVGRDVEKDIQPIVLPKKEYLTFVNPLFKGTKAKDREHAEGMSLYSFSGNTLGLIAFTVPFRYYARIEFDLQILTMKAISSFGMVLMYDGKRRTGYMTNWAQLGLMRGAGFQLVKPSPNPSFNGPADIWHEKTRTYPYVFEYKWLPSADAKKKPSGIARFELDAGQSDASVVELTDGRYSRGQVAFKWQDAKFEVRNLTITGILDREAAVAKLREMTGIKKSGAAEKTEKKTKKKIAENVRKSDAKKGGDFDF
jgi:hypothetical protein